MNEAPPRVSVVMPVFNGEKYLAEAIESILTQSFTDFNLFIVDDGSQDGTAAIIHSYMKRDDRVRSYRLEQNVGSSHARRIGIEHSRGEIIANMDADDISLPERLERQVSFLDANPDITAVGTYAYEEDEKLRRLRTIQPPLHHGSIVMQYYLGLPFVDATLTFWRRLLKDRVYPHVLFSHFTLLLGRARYANMPEPLYVYRRHLDSLTHSHPVNRTLRRVYELEQHRGEVLDLSFAVYEKLRWRRKLSWSERRSAKRGFIGLIDWMIAAKWAEPGDRALMVAEVNKRLEETSPRIWQMFCHWRRHRSNSF